MNIKEVMQKNRLKASQKLKTDAKSQPSTIHVMDLSDNGTASTTSDSKLLGGKPKATSIPAKKPPKKGADGKSSTMDLFAPLISSSTASSSSSSSLSLSLTDQGKDQGKDEGKADEGKDSTTTVMMNLTSKATNKNQNEQKQQIRRAIYKKPGHLLTAAYFAKFHVAQWQKATYNHAMKHKIQQAVQHTRPFCAHVRAKDSPRLFAKEIRVTGFSFEPPSYENKDSTTIPILAPEAAAMGIPFDCPIMATTEETEWELEQPLPQRSAKADAAWCDIRLLADKVKKGELKVKKTTVEKCCGRMPVQVMSDLDPMSRMTPEQRTKAGHDPLNPGGEFVAKKGQIKVINAEEYQRAYNTPLVMPDKQSGVMTVVVMSRPLYLRGRQTVPELRVSKDADGTIVVSIRRPTKSTPRIPLLLLLRAFGITNRETMKCVLKRFAPFTPEEMDEELLVSFENDEHRADMDAAQAIATLVDKFGVFPLNATKAPKQRNFVERPATASPKPMLLSESKGDKNNHPDDVPMTDDFQVFDEGDEGDDMHDDQEDEEEEDFESKVRRARESCRNLLRYRVLPHVGQDDSPQTYLRKTYYIAYMVHRLLAVLKGLKLPDYPDDLCNKSVATCGEILGSYFNYQFGRCWEDARKKMDKAAADGLKPTFENAFDSGILTENMATAVRTGQWSHLQLRIGGTLKNKTGSFTQKPDQQNLTAYLGSLDRVVNNIENKGNVVSPMLVDPTHWSVYDPSMTPDSTKCGLVKQPCVFTQFSSDLTPKEHDQVRKHVEELTSACVGVQDSPSIFGGFSSLSNPSSEEEPKSKPDEIDCHVEGLKLTKAFRVFWNLGAEIRYTFDPDKLIKKTRELRQKGILPRQTYVFVDDVMRIVYVGANEGQIQVTKLVCDEKTFEPLLLLPRNRKWFENLCTTMPVDRWWTYLEKLGFVDYVDVRELWSKCTQVAVAPDSSQKQYFLERYKHEDPVFRLPPPTHACIDPIAQSGLSVASMIGPNHQHSPRVMFFGNQLKSATGLPSYNHQTKTETKTYVLRNPQQDILTTPYGHAIGRRKVPMNQHAIVGIMDYEGYGQEDPIVLNETSVQRGLLVTDQYRVYTKILPKLEDRKTRVTYRLVNPSTVPRCQGMRSKNYSCLPKKEVCVCGHPNPKHTRTHRCSAWLTSGIVPCHTPVEPECVIIGVVSCTPHHDPEDDSIVTRAKEYGRVHQVVITETDEDIIIHVWVVIVLKVGVGSKFAAEAQKHVADKLVPQVDMPFIDGSGIALDVIINPNSFPTRGTGAFTSNQRKCRLVVSEDPMRDCDPHEPGNHEYCRSNHDSMMPSDHQDIRERMLAMGLQEYGYERLRDPRTGELLPGRVAVGILPVLRLPHIPECKVHARGRGCGPVLMVSNAPPKGRSKNGAFRFGALEVNCLEAQGCTAQVQQWMMYCSDVVTIVNCNKCGKPASRREQRDPQDRSKEPAPFSCSTCHENGEIVDLAIPGALRLLSKHTSAMSLCMRLFTSEEDPDSIQSYLFQLQQQIAARQAHDDPFANQRMTD